MGTNYYAVPNRPSTHEGYHIGKSSCGWLFDFAYQNQTWSNPPVVWNNYEEVKDWLYKHTVEEKDFVIMNEYDEIISYDDFIKLVEDTQNDPRNIRNKENFSFSNNVNGYRFTKGWFR